MLHRGLDFHMLRVLCHECGWFRNIAHTGCSDGKRALVSLSRSSDPTHILHARVIEVPANRPLDEVLRENPAYRDLVSEAYENGLLALMSEFQPLLEGQSCPRCESTGKLELSQIQNLGAHVRY